MNAAFYGLVFVLSLFFHDVLGLAPMAARFGPRVPIAVGPVICVLAMAGLVWVDEATARPVVALLLVPVGFGLGMVVPSLTAVVVVMLAAATVAALLLPRRFTAV